MKPIAAAALLTLALPAVAGAQAPGGQAQPAKRIPRNAKHLGAAAVDGNIRKGPDGKCHIVKPAPGQSAGQVAPCPK